MPFPDGAAAAAERKKGGKKGGEEGPSPTVRRLPVPHFDQRAYPRLPPPHPAAILPGQYVVIDRTWAAGAPTVVAVSFEAYVRWEQVSEAGMGRGLVR